MTIVSSTTIIIIITSIITTTIAAAAPGLRRSPKIHTYEECTGLARD